MRQAKNGPGLKEMAAWPQFLLERGGLVVASIHRRRVDSLFEMGLVASSGFSGRLGLEVMLNMFSDCWLRNGLQLPADWLNFYSLCEKVNILRSQYCQSR